MSDVSLDVRLATVDGAIGVESSRTAGASSSFYSKGIISTAADNVSRAANPICRGAMPSRTSFTLTIGRLTERSLLLDMEHWYVSAAFAGSLIAARPKPGLFYWTHFMRIGGNKLIHRRRTHQNRAVGGLA